MSDLTWVSKTDVTRYLRCPYAFWLIDSGRIKPTDLLSPFEAQLIQEGVAFERGIVEAAAPVALPPGREAELFAQDHTILQVRTFANRQIKLIGRPDGLVTANGALQPIEIKSHRLVSHIDRIELAFYWLLLSEHRTARSTEPTGWVFLRRQDGSHAREEVVLSPELLAEAENLIAAVRRARSDGMEPIWCRCTVCRGVRRRDVLESVREQRDVSSVRGVGRVRRGALHAVGYLRWEDLLAGKAEAVARAVNGELRRLGVTADEVRLWQAHARALITSEPVMPADVEPFPVSDEFVALDAEYTADNVWLLGARTVLRDGDLRFAVWASPEGESAALADLGAFLRQHAGLPVVTWNGNSADLPALRKAAARANSDGLVGRLIARHCDLYAWTCRNLMLPIPGFGLKEVSEYFGAPRQSGIGSGLAAEMAWRRYQRTGDQELKAELITYNMDDIDALVRAVYCLRECAAGQPFSSARPLNEVLESTVLEQEPGGPPIPQPEPTRRRPGQRADRLVRTQPPLAVAPRRPKRWRWLSRSARQ